MKPMHEVIKLELDKEVAIKIYCSTSLYNLQCDDDYRIELEIVKGKYILLDNWDAHSEALTRLYDFVAAALQGKLKLHHSITKDIGLLKNEELYAYRLKKGQEKFAYDLTSDGYEWWVGFRYYLWYNTPSTLACWLYEKDKKIFFELTPRYCWPVSDGSNIGNTIAAYEEFIDSYKPLFIFEIPNSVLIRWKHQLGKIMRVIKNNELRQRILLLKDWNHCRSRNIARLLRARCRNR